MPPLHPAAALLAALALAAQALAHLSLLNIYGSNGLVGHGFGVNLHGKYPRQAGLPGDAGGDSGIFQTGTELPSPPCGRTPELGPLDIPAWLDQAEGLGLPAAFANRSVVAEAFQVNRDGGGPMGCEYNEDATATSWKPMFMSLNQAGNAGIQNQVRTNETVVMNFPEGARCSGGWTQTACIVRCRTGVNRRFGGCFAVKLADSSPAAVIAQASLALPPSQAAGVPATVRLDDDSPTEAPPSPSLDADQLARLVQQVILQMKQDGLLVSAASAASTNSSTTPSDGPPAAPSDASPAVQLPQPNASLPASPPSTDTPADTSADASDAADAHLYALANATGSALLAAHLVDQQQQAYHNASALAPSSPPSDPVPLNHTQPFPPPAPKPKPKHHKGHKQPRRCQAPSGHRRR